MTNDNIKKIEDTKFFATVVMHEAWDNPVVFIGFTQSDATTRATNYVEDQMKEYWDGDGELDDWVEQCWEQDMWNIDEAEEVRLA